MKLNRKSWHTLIGTGVVAGMAMLAGDLPSKATPVFYKIAPLAGHGSPFPINRWNSQASASAIYVSSKQPHGANQKPVANVAFGDEWIAWPCSFNQSRTLQSAMSLSSQITVPRYHC